MHQSEYTDDVMKNPMFESAKPRAHSLEREERFYHRATKTLLAIGCWLSATED